MSGIYKPEHIRKSLAEYDGGDALLTANARLLLALPEAEAAPLLQATAKLANTFAKMGPMMAFEVIVKVGRKLATEP